MVLSFCLVLLSFGSGVRGQNENNQDNGQESRGCQLLQGCLGFQHTFDPVGKITGGINHKINKFRTILDIKGKKIRKIFDVKRTIKNFIPAKLQFEIDAIRGIQGALDAKLALKYSENFFKKFLSKK